MQVSTERVVMAFQGGKILLIKERACVFVGFVSNLIYSGTITICATDINIIKKIKGDVKNQP